jgi:hypothetical protein
MGGTAFFWDSIGFVGFSSRFGPTNFANEQKNPKTIDFELQIRIVGESFYFLFPLRRGMRNHNT